MSTKPSKDLQSFDNPKPERDYEIFFDCPEFTCLCPATGQPDFATIRIRYIADKKCVELKSLKLYFHAFRNEGMFFEAVTNKIRDDLARTMSPAWLQIVTDWKGRGGVKSRVIAPSGEVPAAFAAG